MKAPAMTSHRGSGELDSRQDDTEPDDCTDGLLDDATDVDESDLEDADDGRWDAFILDDDGEPLPEYGDFWFPD